MSGGSIGVSGSASTGGGGGGGGDGIAGGAGGSGIIIIRVKEVGYTSTQIAKTGSASEDFCTAAMNPTALYFAGGSESDYGLCPEGDTSPMWSAESVSDCQKLTICGAGDYGTGGVTAAWDVEAISGRNGVGFTDGYPGISRFDTPYNLMCGLVYCLVADSGNHAIRKVDIVSGYTSTLAGSGTAGYNDAVGVLAQFNKPVDVTLDWTETYAYVSDYNNNCIRRIDLTTAAVVVFAGTCTTTATTSTINSNTGDTLFNLPRGLAITDDMGWLIVVDTNNVRKINLVSLSVSLVLTLSASQTAGYPLGLDVFGPKLYIAFESDHRIQQADWTAASPSLTVLAGDGTNGLLDSVSGVTAKFYNPTGVAVDFAGQSLLVADSRDHTIRVIDLASTAVSTLIGTGVAGQEDSIDPNSATLSLPFGVSVTRDGRWALVTDQGNSGIRRFRLDSCTACPDGTFSVNGSTTLDYCLPSFCAPRFEPRGVGARLFDYVGHLTERAGDLLGYEGNLQLWLDASNMDGTFNAAINTISDINQTILDYRPLATWKDLSGKGRDAVALTSSDGARYTTQCELLPKVGIRFNGACGYKTTGTSPLQAKTATILVVLERTGADTATQGHVVSGRLSGGTAVQSLGFQTSTRAFYNRDDLSPGTTDSAFSEDPLLNTVVTHDRVILTATTSYNGLIGISQVFVNGKGAGAVNLGHAAGETGSGGRAVIGAAQDLSSGHNFVGFIQEVIIFDIALSSSQLAAIQLYLSRKWKISPHKMDSDNAGPTDYHDPMQSLSGCSNCNPGTQVYYGQCSTCPAATYSNDGVMCRTCPASSTSFAGATSIAQCSCNPGYYRTSLTSCQACPAGFYCPAVCT